MYQLSPLPRLARHSTRTMPWGTLITGCLAGTAVLYIVAHVADGSHRPFSQAAVRLAFLPAVAALAFVPRAWFRPVSQATPVAGWVVPVGHLLLAAPILAVTGWAQLRIMSHTVPPHFPVQPPAVYPLVAQLTGWCLLAVAAAACVDRSRYADLGGAIAAPVTLAALAFTWYVPLASRVLTAPPATAHGMTIAWCAIAAAALALTGAAMRDHWHRYARVLHRLSFPERNLS